MNLLVGHHAGSTKVDRFDTTSGYQLQYSDIPNSHILFRSANVQLHCVSDTEWGVVYNDLTSHLHGLFLAQHAELHLRHRKSTA